MNKIFQLIACYQSVAYLDKMMSMTMTIIS